jgi:hypothetical protein
MTSTPHRIARRFRHHSWWDVLFFAALAVLGASVLFDTLVLNLGR